MTLPAVYIYKPKLCKSIWVENACNKHKPTIQRWTAGPIALSSERHWIHSDGSWKAGRNKKSIRQTEKRGREMWLIAMRIWTVWSDLTYHFLRFPKHSVPHPQLFHHILPPQSVIIYKPLFGLFAFLSHNPHLHLDLIKLLVSRTSLEIDTFSS